MKLVTALGSLCSATQQLPTSAVLSTGLEKRGNIAVASGGFTDIWRGDLGNLRVAIKAFRIYPAQNLKEAKEVSIQPALEVCSRKKIVDSLETGAGVDEIITSEYFAVPGRKYDPLSAFPCLRLGAKRQHYSVRSLASPRASVISGG